ncbi:MAG: glycerophosphodiester phosphodiesterase [Rubrivivax sp.]|nr:glycerophosphodiester phosphodiesterase [Rubrivivax sp.]
MTPWPYPLWIAHRGAGKLAPENTLAAFRLGASHGYRAFECDVKLSADGVPFLLHDDTLERTTPAQGIAGQRPWSELSRLDAGGWLNRHYAGEPLPSFEAIAAYVLRNGFMLDVEIKPTPGLEHATGVEVARACAAHWRGAATAPPLLSSFRPESLQGAREAAPELPRALLLDTLWEGWAAVAQALDCAAVITQYRLMTAEVIAAVHASGRRALCYTVNDAAEARRLLDLRIDGIITDAVDRFSPSATGLFE